MTPPPSKTKDVLDAYRAETLVQDVIHGYISTPSRIPRPRRGETCFERDIIDSPWLQRLRQIHQLQTAWLVYPSAEHSRFQHALGVAHLASRVWDSARESFMSSATAVMANLDGSTCESARRPVPSPECVEETLRVAALLHDVGHGPFGHFFDDHFLSRYAAPDGETLTHETLGAHIVKTQFADLISGLRRSPRGAFAPGESISPDDVAFLIVRPRSEEEDRRRPAWLRMLRVLFCGLYTIDNMDFVLRDAYYAGFGAKPYDLDRLVHYSFFTERGFTLHRKGAGALFGFLEARHELFRSVYFHRTVRAIDVALADLFREGADLLYPYGNPLDSLDRYLNFTDWTLLADASRWGESGDARKVAQAQEWRDFLNRRVKWRMIAEKTFVFRDNASEGSSVFSSPHLFEAALREKLPAGFETPPLRFDIARVSYRPDSPLSKNYLYDPETEEIVDVSRDPLLRHTPKSARICRVFGRDKTTGVSEIVAAFNKLTAGAADELTNV